MREVQRSVAEMRPQARKEGPVAGSDSESDISVAGEARAMGSFAVRPPVRGPAAVLLSGLADGGEFHDSLAGCRKHTVTARCNQDFGLADAWCQFEEQCVEFLASARKGSEMARGLMTAPFEPPQQQQPAQPAGRCPLCGDAGHSYRQGAYDHPAGREITQQCPLVLSDSKPCGLRHAFSGPMARFAGTVWRAISIVGGGGKFYS
jgi:hypothetical protein